MIARPAITHQPDLFVPFITDLPLRDQREVMERPFFSLAKRKRLTPIEYISPDGSAFVNVLPHHDFGMATIWDADLLIWASSTLNAMRKKNANDLPRTLHFQAYDLLKTIGRATGGRDYQLMREGLDRLQATVVKTNIRVKKGKKERTFHWIEGWTDLVDQETGQSKGMSMTLSDWFFEGILMDGALLSIDPTYFSITGGRERWLYRVARKHAGGAGEAGFAIPFPTMFEKSGAEGDYRRFKFELHRIAQRNSVPGYDLFIEMSKGMGEPSLRMIRRADDEQHHNTENPGNLPEDREKASRKPPPSKTPPAEQHHLTDETIALVRRHFPGWDIYALKSDFDTWLADGEGRTPDNYQKAFYGFCRRFHEGQSAGKPNG